jgi:hypothetical protein
MQNSAAANTIAHGVAHSTEGGVPRRLAPLAALLAEANIEAAAARDARKQRRTAEAAEKLKRVLKAQDTVELLPPTGQLQVTVSECVQLEGMDTPRWGHTAIVRISPTTFKVSGQWPVCTSACSEL